MDDFNMNMNNMRNRWKPRKPKIGKAAKRTAAKGSIIRQESVRREKERTASRMLGSRCKMQMKRGTCSLQKEIPM